ncbi:SemiSWEET family sugar transporter [Pseudodesulfovibrio piezophilus]|uniref:MtN3 and saliva related transmembrane protein (Modular protein) n=1 Tax=Pseudodesulfovibrio piezophilus (strain DSM 21447 / JCM 15486 / C1TLV30) TaxID=1322246 RepID=M1WKX5_PSEP2|nr:SemiSWEET transporter [Pseudodesulfovibrio piezophilus]CCH50356.1 MtN3 and saliva related transmembrane protein (modular protein) [Pseudodesulfovibrio piezophilus C1TLV30]
MFADFYHERVVSVSGPGYTIGMTRETMELIGIVAGFCTTASFLPQVIRTWKSRSVDDISLKMYMLFCVGVLLWLLYGFLIGSLSVILANSVTLFLAGAVLVMKVRFDRER